MEMEQTKTLETSVQEEVKPKPPINITERAITEIKRVMEEQCFAPEEFVLEAGVIGGGCSGFQYKLGFKERKDVNPKVEDLHEFNGLNVSLNRRAMLYMVGTTIDFHEGLNKRGFTFDNPNSTGKCGCGSSFAI